MEYLYGTLIGIAIYSIINTAILLITKEDESLAIWLATGIFGAILWLSSFLIYKIKQYFKYKNIKSIIKNKETGEQFYCNIKYFDDFGWYGEYSKIKRYAKKSEWGLLNPASKEILKQVLVNCERCKFKKTCHGKNVKCHLDENYCVDKFENFKRK